MLCIVGHIYKYMFLLKNGSSNCYEAGKKKIFHSSLDREDFQWIILHTFESL